MTNGRSITVKKAPMGPPNSNLSPSAWEDTLVSILLLELVVVVSAFEGAADEVEAEAPLLLAGDFALGGMVGGTRTV